MGPTGSFRWSGGAAADIRLGSWGERSEWRWGVTVEMAVGERLDPGLLTLLPGDGVSVYRP